jgi:hypothetical protein
MDKGDHMGSPLQIPVTSLQIPVTRQHEKFAQSSIVGYVPGSIIGKG